MKPFILLLVGLLCAALIPDGESQAFHSGGVAPCDACHSMHATAGTGGDTLLRASDAGSVCLNCHERSGDVGPTKYHVSTASADMPIGAPPKQLSPGGDFGWIKKSYSWYAASGQQVLNSPGDEHGHNIVAKDYLYSADPVRTAAPEGNYPSAALSCISCHDPHGKYRRNADGTFTTSGAPIAGSGSFASSASPASGAAVGAYRLLAGRNYHPSSVSSSFAFVSDPPDAVAPDISNRSESSTQTRVAYGWGMTEWCQNCHTTMHVVTSSATSTNPQVHPVGATAKLGAADADTYNTYIKTGDVTGTPASSFLSLVPFEEGTRDYQTLKLHARSDDSYLTGPDASSSQVMCLTCHRAHASGWDGATRWNTATEYIVFNGSYAQEGLPYQPYGQGRSELEAQTAYYGMRESRFALNQDTLCHKCHGGALP